MHQVVALLPLAADPFEIVDGLAVPVAHLVRSHRRATFTMAEADIGYAGSASSRITGCNSCCA